MLRRTFTGLLGSLGLVGFVKSGPMPSENKVRSVRIETTYDLEPILKLGELSSFASKMNSDIENASTKIYITYEDEVVRIFKSNKILHYNSDKHNPYFTTASSAEIGIIQWGNQAQLSHNDTMLTMWNKTKIHIYYNLEEIICTD